VPLTTSNPFKWRHYCAYRKSHPGRSRPAQTDANHKFGPRFRQASRTTRNQRRRLASRKEIWSRCAAGIGTPGVDRLLHRADDSHGLDVIFKEGLPGLRGWLWSACKVLAYVRFADVDAQFEQFPMDARCTPERILAAHLANQLPNLFGHSGTPRLAAMNLPGPERPKAFAVPAKDGFRLDDEQRRSRIPQASDSQAHSSRSAELSFGRFTERRSTASWWRRARFST
jgi:hypothetical protein